MYQLVIADDDEWIRKGLTKVVLWDKLGFEVVLSAASGMEALEYIKDHKVDVILTDINMPEMTGLELIEKARAWAPSLKAVIISGYSEFEYAKTAIELKVENYLLKPLSPEDISAVFIKIKTELDDLGKAARDENGPKIRCEYELMQLLSQKVGYLLDFSRLCAGDKYCELVFVKIFESVVMDRHGDNMAACVLAVRRVLEKHFFCELENRFAVLVRACELDSILGQLETACAPFKHLSYRIAVGKEVYSRSEVVSSYWSAVELVRETESSTLVHYSREHSHYKKDWSALHRLEKTLFDEIEASQQINIDHTVKEILDILKTYEKEDALLSMMDIFERGLDYFHIRPTEDMQLVLKENDRERLLEQSFDALADMFAADVHKLQNNIKASYDTMSKVIVNRALQTIGESFGDKNLTLASLANRLNVSYGYLSTIFAKNIGKSFKTCLVEVRMNKARELLVSRDYKIYEIAEMVGYSTPRYFTDAFRKYFGVAPAEYLANLHRGHSKDGSDSQ